MNGTTSCKWDSVIPFTWHITENEKVLYLEDALKLGFSIDYFNEHKKSGMWERLKKLRKDNSAIVLFGGEPFSSELRMSNLNEYKYDIYWQKERIVNILQVKKRIGKTTENILLFYKKQCTYNPQKTIHKGKIVTNSAPDRCRLGKLVDNQSKTIYKYIDTKTRYPIDILQINRESMYSIVHPTQKPVKLLEYLVKTYSNEGDTILDLTMGSGTTGIASKNLNRNFIGIERNNEYFDIAKDRIENAILGSSLEDNSNVEYDNEETDLLDILGL